MPGLGAFCSCGSSGLASRDANLHPRAGEGQLADPDCRPGRVGDVTLGEGDFYIVPRGVEHKPVAKDETHVLLFEPAKTRNTGNVTNELTIEPDQLPRI